jgi:hypothetical protein
MIQGRELARGQGGGDEARPVRQHEAHPLRDEGRPGGDQEAVRRVRVVADQDAVEAALVMRPAKLSR